jgi:hypothetical protein
VTTVTEEEWLACIEPASMLNFLHGKASDWKLRLFSSACHRRIWDRITDEGVRSIINMMELFVDGKVTFDEMDAAYTESAAGVYGAPRIYDCETALSDAWGTADMSGDAAQEAAAQSAILRDIFGNPFSPIAFDPCWRTLSVVRLAQTMYDSRTFDKMPELADALERAGCRSEPVLGHCREPGEHVRGCWVVDLVLGKE